MKLNKMILKLNNKLFILLLFLQFSCAKQYTYEIMSFSYNKKSLYSKEDTDSVNYFFNISKKISKNIFIKTSHFPWIEHNIYSSSNPLLNELFIDSILNNYTSNYNYNDTFHIKNKNWKKKSNLGYFDFYNHKTKYKEDSLFNFLPELLVYEEKDTHIYIKGYQLMYEISKNNELKYYSLLYCVGGNFNDINSYNLYLKGYKSKKNFRCEMDDFLCFNPKLGFVNICKSPFYISDKGDEVYTLDTIFRYKSKFNISSPKKDLK